MTGVTTTAVASGSATLGKPADVTFSTSLDKRQLGAAIGACANEILLWSARCPQGCITYRAPHDLRRAEWARIVNVSAMSTKRQSPPIVAYTAAKSALTSLTKNLSQSLAPEGILVNTVSPGTFASESFKSFMALVPDVDENDLHDVMRFIKQGYGHSVFLDRAADPSEIGPVIAFAASARNTYMTGANLNVDGGSDFT